MPGGHRFRHRHPLVEHGLGLAQHRLGFADLAVVGQHHPFRPQLDEAVQARGGLLEVEIRRRRRRPQVAHLGEPNAGRIADQQGAGVLVEHRVMVLGVSRRIDQTEMASPAEVDAVAVGGGHQPVLGHREHATVESVEKRPVDQRGAVDQPGRVGEMAGAALVHHHGGLGEGTGEVTDRAGVIEVDVGEHQPAQVGAADAGGFESGDNRVGAAPRAGLDQRGLRSVDQESRGDTAPSPDQGVELPDARRDGLHRGKPNGG